MTRTQRLFGRCFLGALAVVFLVATPASAALEVGAEATDFGSEGCFNTEPVKLSDLKGRLILLELFSTT